MTRAPISDTERGRRKLEIDFARGSVRYGGGILSGEVERLNTRYIDGEIDGDELTAAILASVTARHG